ncbi:MAG: PhoH family protein [Erysipelotrichaceae bacterium]|nr:PhoH family protein [Erysipelotrichaceae bacterium]
MSYKELELEGLDNDQLVSLYGAQNRNIDLLEEIFQNDIIARGNTLSIEEDRYELFKEVVESLCEQIRNGNTIDKILIEQTYFDHMNNRDLSWQNRIILTSASGRPFKYKTYTQYRFAKCVEDNDLVFSIGPAGTGKTFLSVLMACKALKEGDIKKIILSRPAVEAGESLGFLPGDLKEKIDPYLMPLYDSLYEIMSVEHVEKLIEKNIIEVMPLAYMRGRTLNDAFIILDEAQNTTPVQMLMFLTRLGYNSKMIVNGDVTQIDLNLNRSSSGLIKATEKLRDIKGIGFIEYGPKDIVRHPLVEKIISVYHG